MRVLGVTGANAWAKHPTQDLSLVHRHPCGQALTGAWNLTLSPERSFSHGVPLSNGVTESLERQQG